MSIVQTGRLVIVALALLLSLATGQLAACAASGCSQTFTFLGCTPGDTPTFWLVEDKDGVCHVSNLIQVFISEGVGVNASASAAENKGWQWLEDGLSSLKLEPALELEHVGKEWRCPASTTEPDWTAKGAGAGLQDSVAFTWTVRSPLPAPELKKLWIEELGHGRGSAEEWNREYRWDGIWWPKFKGTTPAEVAFAPRYEYPSGLYFDYDIAKAYYFPKCGYLLVLTTQPLLSASGDTMHGFVLLKEFRISPRGVASAVGAESDSVSDLEMARQALTTFFSLLHDGHYDEAINYYGGSYEVLRDWNPPVDRWNYTGLLENGCTVNGLQCKPIRRIVDQEELSPTTFRFKVEFMEDDGGLFIRGPCCGASPEQEPPESRFTYTVKKVGYRFLVQELPVYVP